MREVMAGKTASVTMKCGHSPDPHLDCPGDTEDGRDPLDRAPVVLVFHIRVLTITSGSRFIDFVCAVPLIAVPGVAVFFDQYIFLHINDRGHTEIIVPEELGEGENDERTAGHEHEHDGDEEAEEGRVLGLVTEQ